MRMRKRIFALALSALMLFSAVSLALAWPDQPPSRAFISGRGIESGVEITNPDLLDDLRLGGLEDLGWGPIQKPEALGAAYQIRRYFENNTFRFADLTYYPNPNGARSYVYWEDGSQLSGDHTPFHKKWLYTNSSADHAMQAFLHSQGVTLADKSDGNIQLQARLDQLPERIVVGQPVTLGLTLPQNFKGVPVTFLRSGDTSKTEVIASAGGAPGHYTVGFTFPSEGEWNWSVRTDTNGAEIPLPPLTIVDPNAPIQKSNSQTSTNAVSIMPPLSTFLFGVFAALLGIVGIGGIVISKFRK